VSIFLAILTYFGYVFVVTMYTVKAVKYLRRPRHLRWDLYPVMHEERYRYGGSYYEDIGGAAGARKKHRLRGILFLLKEYVTMGEYFKRRKTYWLALYPWHVGFMLIIAFHIFTFFAAVVMLAGVPVSAGSPFAAGRIFYYVVLFMGVVSFASGIVGSIGVAVKRLTASDLRDYATPQNYFTYAFCLAVFLSGFYAWYFVDPTFSEYRQFWVGLITWKPIMVAPAATLHIVLFDLFLIYLPFTRSMHYITRIFAFLFIRWDDEPNLRGSRLESRLMSQLGQKVTWGAAHIKSGGTWADQVAEQNGGAP
jgi:nitrate reductase gamma subunit